MLWLGSRHHSPLQNPSTSVLRGRLVSSCSNLPSNPCLHVSSCHFSTGPPVVSSLVPSLSTFSAKIPEHKLRCWSTARMRGLPYDRNQYFVYAFLRFSPDWSRRRKTRCRPVLQHTTFMAGKVCFSYVFKKNRSSSTTSLNTEEWSERITIGPAGRYCASQAPQLCLAAARMNLRLAPPRRNTRTNVRFDVLVNARNVSSCLQ